MIPGASGKHDLLAFPLPCVSRLDSLIYPSRPALPLPISHLPSPFAHHEFQAIQLFWHDVFDMS